MKLGVITKINTLNGIKKVVKIKFTKLNTCKIF